MEFPCVLGILILVSPPGFQNEKQDETGKQSVRDRQQDRFRMQVDHLELYSVHGDHMRRYFVEFFRLPFFLDSLTSHPPASNRNSELRLVESIGVTQLAETEIIIYGGHN